MIALRAFLALVILAVGTYTGIVIANHGLNLFPVFFGDMAELTWRGQFNLDFMCMLAFSGLSVAFRHRFSRVVSVAIPKRRNLTGSRFPDDVRESA